MSNEEVAQQTREFMGAIGFRRIVDIGYKYDGRSAQYKLLDVNPRIGTTFRPLSTPAAWTWRAP